MVQNMWRPYPETLRETPLGRVEVEIYRPRETQVVMGAGGIPEREVHLEKIRASGTPLFKRKGGGGTVLLGPQTLVVTIHAGVGHRFRNLAYFKALNDALIQVMRTWDGQLPYRQRGISDIAVNDQKIVGSSIFRRKQYLLYQASILVDLDLDLMDMLLKMPPRAPDYRAGRKHADFLTCLRALGVRRGYESMLESLEQQLPLLVPSHLALVDRQPESLATATTGV